MNTQHQDKVSELVNLFASNLKLECERLYRSKMIDVDSFDSYHYKLAKVLISAAIGRTKGDVYIEEFREDIENLILM